MCDAVLAETEVKVEPIVLSEVGLSIGAERLHGHAQRVLDNAPGLEEEVRLAVTRRVGIVRSLRKKGDGLTAGSLNEALKRSLRESGEWSFEATVREGVILDSASPATKREGFDVARYDYRANAARMWTHCFGSRALARGGDIWEQFKRRRPDQHEVLAEVESLGSEGEDLALESRVVTILGDIQFGNWGLGYRDILRLIDADDQIRVELYVYVTGEDSLNRYLSDSIVTFRQTVDLLQQFPRLVRVPVWVIGLAAQDFE